MTTPLEIELKLRLEEGASDLLRTHPRVEAAALGPWRASRIDNRYFDTADHALAQAGMALRLRRVGGRWVQTLKAAGDADPPAGGALSARAEWEMPVAGPRLELGRLRDTPLASIASMRALAGRLVPVFTTNFRRETRLLRLPVEGGGDIVVELALDAGLITRGRARTRRTAVIGELEIELKDTGADDAARGAMALLRFARRLARDVALVPLADSKAQRGYRLVADEARVPVKVALPVVDGQADARSHAVEILAACDAAALANVHVLLDVASHADRAAVDPEFVHQARVAVRKLRSAAGAFRQVIGRARAATFERAWRDIGRALGGARDWDVLVEGLPSLIEHVASGDGGAPLDHAAIARIEAAAHAARERAYDALFVALRAADVGHAALTLEVFVWKARRRKDDAGVPIADFAKAWLARQERRLVERARRIAALDDDERHALRIEVKRLRYGLEFFDGLFPDTGYVELLGKLQAELGILTDAVVARSRIALLVREDEAATALARHERWLQRQLGKRLPKVASQAVRLEMNEKPWQPR